MVLKPIGGDKRSAYRQVRRILFALGTLSIVGAIIWPLGLAFGLFPLSNLPTGLSLEGTLVVFAILLFPNYRVVAKGDEARIYSQKMMTVLGLPFSFVAGMLVVLLGFGGWPQTESLTLADPLFSLTRSLPSDGLSVSTYSGDGQTSSEI